MPLGVQILTIEPNDDIDHSMNKTKAKAETNLTYLQQNFVQAYLGSAQGNATLACRQAGYKGDDNALGKQGHVNLHKPKIAQEIARQKAESQAETGMDVNWWLREMRRTLRDARDKGDQATVSAILRQFGQHLGVFEEDNRQRGDKIGIVLR